MAYADYLRSLGTAEEDIKTLDTGAARKAYDAMEARLAAAAEETANARKDHADYKATVEEWYSTKIDPEFQKLRNDVITTQADRERYRAAIIAAREQGLADIAKGLGIDDNPRVPVKQEPPVAGFDSSKYLTKDEIVRLAEQEGDAIAVAQDIASEHQTLFGNRINFRQLRADARAARKPVEQFWMEKYKVSDARAEQDRKAQQERDDKIRKEEREKVSSEFASKYANPDTRPLSTSTNFLTPRPETNRDKMPWDNESRTNERVTRVTQRLMKDSVTH